MKAKETKRQVRVPISGGRDVLSVRGTENLEKEYHLCYVNDYLVDKYMLGGYEFVYWHELTDENEKVGDSHVNTDSSMESRVSKNVGNGVTGFLMKIPNELWEEDKADHDRRTNELEAAMKTQLNSGANGQYGKVQIQT